MTIGEMKIFASNPFDFAQGRLRRKNKYAPRMGDPFCRDME
jgi:hypothetical protein